MFAKKFRNFSWKKNPDINQNFTSISKISKTSVKFEFLSQKTNPVFGSKSLEKFGESLEKFGKVRKVQKSLESSEKFGKVWKSLETGFSECLEISEILKIVLFRTFQKLRKNDVKLELESLVKSSECRALTQM